MLKLIVLVAFTASFAQAQKCPDNDADYKGGDLKLNLDVPSWKACGEGCQKEAGCTGFTYVQKTKCCYLKNGDARSTRVAAPGLISGDKNCPDRCLQKDVNFAGYNVPGEIVKSETWEDCKKLCNSNQDCFAISYVSEHINKAYIKNCHLKTKDYRNGRSDQQGVMSGSKECFGTGTQQTEGGNANGASCVFPFTYQGKTYDSCINDNNGCEMWCGTTANYDTDKKWGNCKGGKAAIINANSNVCWGAAGGKGGLNEKTCGKGGCCCRNGFNDCPTWIANKAPSNHHTCMRITYSGQ
jgi:hypothetical protein